MTTNTNSASPLDIQLGNDLQWLHKNVTEEMRKIALDAATTVTGSPQHSRAMHLLVQEIPPLLLHGILLRLLRPHTHSSRSSSG